MPFCPKCRYEYRDDVFKCPDCGEWLVPQLPEEDDESDEPQYDNWIPLARLTSTASVAMLIEALQAKNIPASTHSGMGHFGLTGAMGLSSYVSAGDSIIVLVPEEFIADAYYEAAVIMGEEWEKVRLIDIEEEPDEEEK
jgi:hypothetical protein